MVPVGCRLGRHWIGIDQLIGSGRQRWQLDPLCRCGADLNVMLIPVTLVRRDRFWSGNYSQHCKSPTWNEDKLGQFGMIPLHQHIISSTSGWFATVQSLQRSYHPLDYQFPSAPHICAVDASAITITRWCTNNARHHVLRFWAVEISWCIYNSIMVPHR